MDTYTEILKSLPTTAFRVNAAGNAVVDITGRGVALSATPTLVTPINAGSTRSMHVSSAGISFPSKVFIRGQEKRGFSLEATVLPTESGSGLNLSILSHVGVWDGLALVGDQLWFTVNFETTGSAWVTYEIPKNFEKMVVIGTYSTGAVKLYVNGEVVGSMAVTTEQVKDGFKTRANNNLYMGQGVSARTGIVDSLAVYGRTLTDAEAYMHYQGSIRSVPSDTATQSLPPVTFDGTGRNIYSKKEWTGNLFADGVHTDTSYDDTGLIPQIDFVTQLSKASTWIGTFELPPNTDIPKIYGVKVEYEGVGSYTVSFSKDNGTTWLTPETFDQLAGTFDWTPTGQPVLARVQFAGGNTDDVSTITRIALTAYLSRTVLSSDSGRSIQLSSGNLTSDEQFEPITGKRYNGIVGKAVQFDLLADTDVDDPKPVIALETWITFENLTNAYVFDNRPGGGTHYLWHSGGKFLYPAGGVLYVNGISVASGVADTMVGVPNHVLYVFPASFTTPIVFGATQKTYHFIKTYATAPTAADAARIYNAYINYPLARLVTESNPVTEGASAYKTYGYDWSITQAG